MPWTPAQFRAKHNRKLSLKQAGKAADIASAMIERGVDEGIAIATANKRARAAAAREPTSAQRAAAKTKTPPKRKPPPPPPPEDDQEPVFRRAQRRPSRLAMVLFNVANRRGEKA